MRELALSFEYFPPKSIKSAFGLSNVAQQLDRLSPRFTSMTCGAGGSSQDRTIDAALALKSATSAPVAAHITCADQSIQDLEATINDYLASGICEFVALRGDAPHGKTAYAPHPEGHDTVLGLIKQLALSGARAIRVGAYPDLHRDATNLDQHIDFLARKFDAGATEAITQFFFDIETFLRLRDRAVSRGFSDKITPGILPINNWERAKSFAKTCSIPIPLALDRGFETAHRDGHAALYSLTHTTTLCDRLIGEGVSALHLFTLNTAKHSLDICAALGKTPKSQILRAA